MNFSLGSVAKFREHCVDSVLAEFPGVQRGCDGVSVMRQSGLSISRGIIEETPGKSEVRAHQMARKVLSAWFAPHKSELSSHQIAILGSCGVPG